MITLCRALLLVAAVLVAFVATPASLAGADHQPTCDWMAEYDGTLAALGEDPAQWTVAELPADVGGQVDQLTNVATISPDAPCWAVGDMVRHEYAHRLQNRAYGSWFAAAQAYGSTERGELIADCASQLLGSTYTPYVDDHVETTGIGCEGTDLANAQYLLISAGT